MAKPKFPPSLLILCLVVASWAVPAYTCSAQSYDEFLEKANAAVSKRDKAEVYLEMSEDFIEDMPLKAKSMTEDLVLLVEGQNSKKALAYLLKGQAHYYLDENSFAISSFKNADSLSQKFNKDNLELQANILSYWGSTLLFMGDYTEGIVISKRGLQVANRTKNEELKASILSDLSFANLKIGDYEASLKQRLEAYNIHKLENDSSEIKIDLNELAIIYKERNQLDESIRYLKESGKYIGREGTLQDSLVLFNNLSNVYMRKYRIDSLRSNLDSTELYLNRGLSGIGNKKFIRESIPIYINYSDLEIQNGAFNLANQYLNDADQIIDSLNEKTFLPRSLNVRSKLEYENGNYSKSLFIINQLLNNTSLSIPSDTQLKLIKRKSDILLKVRRYEEAAFTMNQYLELREEYISNLSTKELERFRTVYETDLKEERILRLEEQQKEERKRKQVGFSVLLALLILSIGFMLFLRYTFQQRRQIKALEYEKLISQRENQIELLQERVSTFVDKPVRENKEIEALPELEEINESLLTQITEREYEVLKSIEQGLSNKEIAEVHFISVNTVKYHLRNIYTKLDVSNRIQVIQRLRTFG